MSLRLVFVDEQTAEFRAGERLLARYAAAPKVPANESPKPCLHPVMTLAGETVTDFRPSDHTWHHGIAWAFTYINDDTFWGGPTFLDPERGYQWCENHGQQRHLSWQAATTKSLSPETVCLQQNLEWVSSTRQILLKESRTLSATLVDETTWRLDFASEFANATDKPLTFRSPVGRGRSSGGYFGLMWRGAPSWANGKVHSATPRPDMMGHAAAWLAYEPGPQRRPSASVQFLDHPANPRFPTTWFVRCEAEPIASFALAYAEPLILSPAALLNLRYAIAFTDRPFSAARAEQIAQSYWRSTSP